MELYSLLSLLKLVVVAVIIAVTYSVVWRKLSNSSKDLPIGLKYWPLLGHLPLIWEVVPHGFPQNIHLKMWGSFTKDLKMWGSFTKDLKKNGHPYYMKISAILCFTTILIMVENELGLQQTVFGFQQIFRHEPLVNLIITVIPYTFVLKADAAEVILSSNKEITKSREYNFFESWLGLGLLTSTGAKWKKRRKMLTPSFHFRVLTDFQEVINEHGFAFVDHLSKQVDKTHVDMLHFLTMCTLDVICETAMGVHIDAQNNSDSAYVRALHDMSEIAVERAVRVLHFNDTIFGLTTSGRIYKKALTTVHDFTKKIIKNRISERLASCNSNKTETDDTKVKKRLAFLDLLVDEHFKNPEFTESDIQEEVDTFMFEGHDTTAVGLSWVMYLLGLHPNIQERLYNEIIQVLGDDKRTVITETELKELKYLECVIKESQRMFPSVPFIGRKLENDMSICGKLVPKGTNCLVSIAAIHRDPDVFPEPYKFDPDRFTMENSSGRHPYGYIPFSAGPRNCIGQKFALNEEKTIMAHVIRNFTWKSLDPMDKVTFAPNMVSRPIPGHRIKLFKRL